MSNIGKSGSTGRSPSTKTNGTPESTNPAEVPPVEAVKKFEDALDKKKDAKVVKEEPKVKEEEGGMLSVFKDLMQKVKPQQSRQQPSQPSHSSLVTNQAVQSALEKLKEQSNPGAEMKIAKEGKKGLEKELGKGELKAQIFDKSDKLQALHGKSEHDGKGQEESESSLMEGKDKINSKLEEGEKAEFKLDQKKEMNSKIIEKTEMASGLSQVQNVGPFGQTVAATTAAQQTAPSSSVKEMAELASTMLTRIMATHEASTAGKEVRMTFGDLNPNLKNVDVVIKKEGDTLSIEFLTTKNVDAGNYLNQNKDSLNVFLRQALPEVTDIRIDINQKAPDSQKDDSQGQSRGRREPQPEEEEGEE